MAFFKKTTSSSSNSAPKSGSQMPTEIVQVISYDNEANEIIARRIQRDGETVRIAFAPNQKPGRFARPEVAHFTGRIKKPRDMSSPAGSILKVNRQGITEDLTKGKMMISWADAWARNPSEEFVFKGYASITYLAEKSELRADNTKGYKGMLTVIQEQGFTDFSQNGQMEGVWQGELPQVVSSADEMSERIETLLAKGLSAGLRFRTDDEQGKPEMDAVMLYPKLNQNPEDTVKDFISRLEDGLLEQIGKDVQVEVIPAISLQIGNDTASALYTGLNGEGRASHFANVRTTFQGEVGEGDRKRTLPRFMDSAIMVRIRHPQSGEAYYSVENLSPLYYTGNMPSIGVANALLTARTPGADLFPIARRDSGRPSAPTSAPQDGASAPSNAPADTAPATRHEAPRQPARQAPAATQPANNAPTRRQAPAQSAPAATTPAKQAAAEGVEREPVQQARATPTAARSNQRPTPQPEPEPIQEPASFEDSLFADPEPEPAPAKESIESAFDMLDEDLPGFEEVAFDESDLFGDSADLEPTPAPTRPRQGMRT